MHACFKGDNYDAWPLNRRRIFPDDILMRHPSSGEWVRHGFAYDLLLTVIPETFFVFCVFGMEYAINVGGPSMRGYEQRLQQNQAKSPLIELCARRLRTGHHEGEIRHFLEENSKRRAD
jgi:hypothetical protein